MCHLISLRGEWGQTCVLRTILAYAQDENNTVRTIVQAAACVVRTVPPYMCKAQRCRENSLGHLIHVCRDKY